MPDLDKRLTHLVHTPYLFVNLTLLAIFYRFKRCRVSDQAFVHTTFKLKDITNVAHCFLCVCVEVLINVGSSKRIS